MEHHVSHEITDKFSVMFDGWSDGQMHYVALFATYLSKGTYRETLISCAPLRKQDDFSSHQHVSFIKDSLSY